MTTFPKSPLSWKPSSTPPEVAVALRVLGDKFPIYEGGDAHQLVFRLGDDPECCRVLRGETGFVVEYSRTNQALRAVGALLSGFIPTEERCPFSMVGVMLDCSRNAVPTIAYLKTFLTRSALLGFNTLLLYTEDTYQIADEPHFGYMRGAYTEAELRELDSFAARLGIEIIPCLQTLGHLEQILRWPAFRDLKDTDDVLLVDEPKTYVLIEKMIATWANVVGSRRIHIGMDETHSVGRGRFYDLHGDERHFDLFNRHLTRVVEICRKHGLQPMIWSDMYFRMGNPKNDYYDPDTVIPDDVARAIPKDVGLVYWDYYHDSKTFYAEWMERHRRLGRVPVMASGVWAGNKFWYDRHITEKIVPPCLEACRETGVREVLFTLWGDDGLLCDLDSAMAGLAFAAEQTFTGEASTERLNAQFDALFDGACYDAIRGISELERKGVFPASTLWDDPLMNIFLAGVWFRDRENGTTVFADAQHTCDAVGQLVRQTSSGGSAGDLVLAASLSAALAAKFGLVETLLSAYLAGDRVALETVFPRVATYGQKLEELSEAYRAMWHRNYKPFGLETMQIRFAGQKARLKELARRLRDYLDGQSDSLPELEEIQRVKGVGSTWRYKNVSHGSVIL